MTLLTRAVSAASAILICAAALAGCGSSSTSSGATATTAAPQATTSQSPGQAGAPGGFDSAAIQQVQQCLQAAGITMPSAPSGAPGGDFTPGGTPPSGASGRPGGGAGGGGLFNTPEAQAALKACGITMPTNPARG